MMIKRLFILRLLGFGVKQNTDEALKWWKQCSESESVSGIRAMNTLALFYSTPDYADKEKVKRFQTTDDDPFKCRRSHGMLKQQKMVIETRWEH